MTTILTMAINPMLYRWPWLCLAWTSLGLGALGLVLPLLPTTPFVLLAAWAAPKGSPRLQFWLYRHPRFGPLLRMWHRERAVPRRAKLATVIMLTMSWLLLWRSGAAGVLLAFLALLFTAVGFYLLTRPSPRRELADEA